MNARQPAPLVVCGPSGVGKSVLIKHLQASFPEKFGFSVSHTTRAPRPGEEEGIAYHFTSLAAMQEDVEAGLFIENAMVHGNMYGTSRAAVSRVGQAGKICILDIDVQGARRIKDSGAFPEVRFIFIMPPSHEELERRLRGRGTETEEKVQRRLGAAKQEMELCRRFGFFDHVFVLDGLEGGRVPPCVQQLCILLQGWYPSLDAKPGARGGTILDLQPREIFDAQGFRTLEVDLITASGLFRAAAPMQRELASERETAGQMTGTSTLPAVSYVREVLRPKLRGLDVVQQHVLDCCLLECLAETHPSAGSASAASLAVSMAACRAGAASSSAPLCEHIARLAGLRTDCYEMPAPAVTVLSGGHGAPAPLACQELMILPWAASSLGEAVAMATEVQHALRALLKERCGPSALNVVEDGAFPLSSSGVRGDLEALELLAQAIVRSGHAGRVSIGANISAASLWDPQSQVYRLGSGLGGAQPVKLTSEELTGMYLEWLAKSLPIAFLQEPFRPEDGDSWLRLRLAAAQPVQLQLQLPGGGKSGESPDAPEEAAASASHAFLLDISRFSTISDAIQVATHSNRAGQALTISHCSGETEDTFIADLAVGLHSAQLKAGAFCRSERVAKYNALMRIESDLGSLACFRRR